MLQNKQRRRDIIDEFFRAYHAARRQSTYGGRCASCVVPSPHMRRVRETVPPCIAALGLPWPCTEREIKQAFRVQVKRVHPDVGGSSEAFQALWQVYQEALTLVR